MDTIIIIHPLEKLNLEERVKLRCGYWILIMMGRAVFPRQVFFPMSGRKDGWNKLAKSLKTEIDESLIQKYTGTESLPFELGEHQKIAVKIIDDRGIESLKIIDLSNENVVKVKKTA